MSINLSRKRIVLSFFILFLAIILLLVKAFRLQVMPSDATIKLAEKQYKGEVRLLPRRGDIFDRNGNPLAITVEFYSLFADPKIIKNKEEVAKILSQKLNLKYSKLISKISNKKRFVWIKRLLLEEEYSKVRDLVKKNRGIGVKREPKRIYPNGMLASHVLGFVNRDCAGVNGIESFYDDFLKSDRHRVRYKKDARGRPIYSGSNIFLISDNENALYLTIDKTLQYQVERELKLAVEKRKALSGTVIIMHPHTGEILSLANYPTYDPNRPGRYKVFNRKNRAITDVFEPGSVFKIITAALALKYEVVNLKQKIWGEEGRFQIGSGENAVIIKEADEHDYGWMNLSELISKSSNIGSAKLGILLGKDRFFSGIGEFGFGIKTYIDLPGEVRGLINRKGGKVLLATMGFGHGIAVTPIQMLRAYCIISNGGYDVTPHVVKKILSTSGDEIFAFSDRSEDRIISEELSKKLSKMLRMVVKTGTGTATDITGFEVGGKTGTAQKPDPLRGGYSDDKYVVTFSGFFPVSDPKYAVLVLIDEPQGVHYASAVAVPLFRRISNIIIQSQSIAPKYVASSKPDKKRVSMKSKKEKEAFKRDWHSGTVPDVVGMSLRDALGFLSNEWKDVKINGTGKIVRQLPFPGKRGESEKVITLWLE